MILGIQRILFFTFQKTNVSRVIVYLIKEFLQRINKKNYLHSITKVTKIQKLVIL